MCKQVPPAVEPFFEDPYLRNLRIQNTPPRLRSFLTEGARKEIERAIEEQKQQIAANEHNQKYQACQTYQDPFGEYK